ncbi:hypothetical protein D9757_000571 [Collybiopsis confluens]|uniref:Phosphatidic acid phosphatase type 2/haloperoxidase domain-containing protein n=1 Tax=Collybiopsis confluens TaxID=2823264 RepID=A0A8H5I200_9AGAR|nr:hypothetical protein D9757_000571 [Collybiopsis confluens]
MRRTFGLNSASICTQIDMAILKDGFRSFPSGHSSLSFAGLGFLSFYLAGKLHLFDHKGYLGKVWLFITPLSDHWQDVLVGSILGIFMAYFAYRQYYPSLASEFCHKPYSPRIKREPGIPLHVPLHLRHDSSASAGIPEATALQSAQDESLVPPQTVPRPDPGPLTEMWRRDSREGSRS